MTNRLTVTLAIVAGLVLGQAAVSSPTVVCTALGTLTATLQLCRPSQNEVGWDAAMNNNLDVLDSFFTNGAGNPIIKLRTFADPATPASGALWQSTSAANTLKYSDGGATIRSLVDLSLTQTLTNKTLSG